MSRHRLLVAVTLLAGGAATAPPAHADGSVSSFVPAGFKLARSKAVDLDGDGRSDRALVLRRTRAGQGGARPRRLVILRGTGGGRFAGAGTGKRILLCTRCGGAFFGVATPPIRLSVKAGSLVVRQESGSREVTTQTFRLRLRAGATTLIGYDERVRDRLTGGVTATSTNLLTGERTVKVTDPESGTTTKRSQVGACRQPLRRVRASDPLRGC